MLEIKFIDDDVVPTIELSNDDEPNNKFVEFTQEQLDKISNYKGIIIGIDDKIITNIPKNIISVRFGWRFNLDPQPYLHSKIKYLKFKHKFNLPINNLPENLECLVLGNAFNHPVNNLPWTLKSLCFCNSFNQNIDMLPDGLEILYLPNCFNRPILNLPPGLKDLKLGSNFSHFVDFLPNTIENLELWIGYDLPIYNLPKNLKKFIVRSVNNNSEHKIDLDHIKKLTNAEIIIR